MKWWTDEPSSENFHFQTFGTFASEQLEDTYEILLLKREKHNYSHSSLVDIFCKKIK